MIKIMSQILPHTSFLFFLFSLFSLFSLDYDAMPHIKIIFVKTYAVNDPILICSRRFPLNKTSPTQSCLVSHPQLHSRRCLPSQFFCDKLFKSLRCSKKSLRKLRTRKVIFFGHLVGCPKKHCANTLFIQMFFCRNKYVGLGIDPEPRKCIFGSS